MLQWMVGRSKYNWHLQLFSALWAYMNIVKISTGFTSFHLVYGLEATLLIECEIFSLKLVVELLLNTTSEEEQFLYLNKLNKTRRDATLENKVHKR